MGHQEPASMHTPAAISPPAPVGCCPLPQVPSPPPAPMRGTPPRPAHDSEEEGSGRPDGAEHASPAIEEQVSCQPLPENQIRPRLRRPAPNPQPVLQRQTSPFKSTSLIPANECSLVSSRSPSCSPIQLIASPRPSSSASSEPIRSSSSEARSDIAPLMSTTSSRGSRITHSKDNPIQQS